MKVTEYIKETKAELQHVTWPTKKQAIIFTIVVIVISVATSIYLGVFDFLFSLILKKII